MQKGLYDITLTLFKTKLKISRNLILPTMNIKDDEDYQTYLNNLAFLAGYLFDHPIFINV